MRFSALVSIVAVLTLAACSSKTATVGTTTTIASATATTVAAAPTTPKTTAVAPKSSTYSIGQTAKTGGFSATVYAVKDPQPPVDQFDVPKAGMHFVSVDVQVTNSGSSSTTFSSLVGFHLLDSLNHQYDEEISTITPAAPEGVIAGGQSIRGLVIFQVPDGTKGLRLKVQGGFTATGAVWQLS